MNELNAYQFEQFTEIKGKFSSKISLGKSGGFGFSTGFVEKNNLREYRGFQLFFDRSHKAVAFKFLKDTADKKGVIRLKIRDKSGGFATSRSFLGKYSIDPKKYSGKYDPKLINDETHGKLFVIELKETQSSQS